MAKIQLFVNNRTRVIDVEPTMPLLWVLRDVIGLTATKYGCGIGQCGACTVMIDGQTIRSCSYLAIDANQKNIITLEGISDNDFHPVQQAWIDEQVPQCGYCQNGQIMNAIALLEENSNPTDQEIKEHMAGVICRCGTYPRILKAIKRAANQ
ncbi:(2Fe-2S)-binding protein [uncultured Aquimarina sp.]|uniref:(2Fe-2S)-binding protein n=1 Tax=uncultured Aquimarina sp. TaxID=575652 RepID=UPI002619A81B|nr:(2Fe-2S)-binding protein [uncultured Aquimarina sp.]